MAVTGEPTDSTKLFCENKIEEKDNGSDSISIGENRGNVYGCYVHGIFDKPEVAKGIAEALLQEKGMETDVEAKDLKAYKESQYDLLADIIRENLDMKRIYEIIEKGNQATWDL